MSTDASGFVQRIERLNADLVAQGRRVQTMLEAAFDAIFARDTAKAEWVRQQDDIIDEVDVQLEQACVQLLADATKQGAELAVNHLRSVLVIVKVNNEFERTADTAVELAELVVNNKIGQTVFPDTFRVMSNSVIGIVRDVNASIMRHDPHLANIVLQSQHAVTAFKDALLRDAEEKLAKGQTTADAAFSLLEVATACEIIADHCTNIAEQVIYQTTGAIVRHAQTQWVQVPRGQQSSSPTPPPKSPSTT
jgi:phosphate transport system protein